MDRKPRILALTEHYLPGFKAGGPIRSLSAIVENLSADFEFRIMTRNHDWREEQPYAGVEEGRWMSVGSAEVLYLPRRSALDPVVADAIAATPHDVLYVNSLFAPRFSAVPLLARTFRPGGDALVVAPRGELAPGALWIKRPRKLAYLALSHAIGVHRDAVWHASNPDEAAQIRRYFPAADVVVAENLLLPGERGHRRSTKIKGTLRLLCVARLSRNKNIETAIRAVSALDGQVELLVAGPPDSAEYLRECERLVPARDSLSVRFLGGVEPDRLPELYGSADAFFLPTMGENFGHAIAEALRSGCPVVISDRTPWNGVAEAEAGWIASPMDTEAFSRVLARLLGLTAEEHQRHVDAALRYVNGAAHEESVSRSRSVFERALGAPARRQAATGVRVAHA